MKSEVSIRQAKQILEAIHAAAAFADRERDYLVGGREGLGTQQVVEATAKVLSLFLGGLDYIETQLHQSLQLPLQDSKRDLRLAYYATRTSDIAAISSSLEIASKNFSQAGKIYENHAFLRILCFCGLGVLESLQGDREGMFHQFREALSELEAFRFLKISAAMARLVAIPGAGEFIRADLERQAAAKIDALPIPEWGVTLAELGDTLHAVCEARAGSNDPTIPEAPIFAPIFASGDR